MSVPTILYSKYIKQKGYVYSIDRYGKKYCVVNTHRKENMVDRDGPEYIEKEFNTFEKAKKYIDNL